MNEQSNREIAEGNKLIAEFTGADVSDGYARWVTEIPNGTFSRNIPIEQLKYHSDWNELMPVVEKIEAMGYKFDVYFKSAEIVITEDLEHVICCHSDTKLQATYAAIIEFLKYIEEK